MKICEKCGKEILENEIGYHNCEAVVENVIVSDNKTSQSNKKRVIILLACIVVIVGFVVGIFASSGEKYEKVAEEYVESLLTWDIAGTHKKTIFNEEEYDIAFAQANKKISSVSEMYSLLSKEYFSWEEATDNYEDFYKGLTKNLQSNYAIDTTKILSVDSVEMTSADLMMTKSNIKNRETEYNKSYPLSEKAIIDADRITEGYVVNFVVQLGESEENVAVEIVKYDDEWLVAYNMCFKDAMNAIGTDTDDIPVLRTKIADAVLKDTLLSLAYSVGGTFSISYEEVLTECALDTNYEFLTFEEGKNEYLTSEEIKYFEDEYAEDIENAYFAVVTGRISQNPEIAHFYTENQEIMCILMWFDEDEKLTGITKKRVCSEFDLCATLLCLQ